MTHLVVHHSGDVYNGSDWSVEVRRIWNLHKFTRGWGDIGYNYLIDPNGVIYEGRAGGDNVIGAHFCSRNTGTFGVCVLGNFQSEYPTQAALNSLKSLLAWKAGQRGINPLGATLHSNSGLNLNNISGHQDGCSTECPGNNLYSLLPSIRTDVNNLVSGGGLPDLTIVEPVVVSPTSVAPGGTIRVDWTEKNKGTAASTPAHNTKIFLSSSAYGTTHEIAYYGPMNTLGVGATHGYYGDIVVPASIPAGDYYVTAFIDCDQQVSEGNDNNNIGSSSPNRVAVTPNNISVTVQPSPSGRSFTVNGTTYTAAQTFSLAPGSSLTIAATSPQSGGTGIQYVWSSWSDGGAISHTVTPTTSTTYTANFATQYYLTTQANPGGAGYTNPSSGWQNAGQPISLFAGANTGYTFQNWSGTGNGSYSGPVNQFSIVMNGPITQTASFASSPTTVAITIGSTPTGRQMTVDGANYSVATTFNWTPGSQHTVSAPSPQYSTDQLTRYVFAAWADGPSQSSRTITTPASGTSYTALFNQEFRLTMAHGAGGTVTPSDGWFAPDTQVNITAAAQANYVFTAWVGSGNGSYSGPNASATITMRAPITQTASFTSSPTTVAITIGSTPAGRQMTVDGANYSVATTFNWTPGSQHTVSAASPQYSTDQLTRYVFAAWADGPSQSSRTITTPSSGTSYTALFNQEFRLTMAHGAGGTVTPSDGWIAPDTQVNITAAAEANYVFAGWVGSGNGSYSGPNGSATITMRAPITETANFMYDPVVEVAATQIVSGGYRSPGSVTVNCQFTYPSGRSLLSLNWRPTLPSGWNVTSVTGDGAPEFRGGEIVFVGSSLTANPINLSYVITVPAGETGNKDVAAMVDYQLDGMVNPLMIQATPNPLRLTPVIYHTADYRDAHWQIDGTEVNRVLSYWRAGAHHADTAGLDGFAPGTGDTSGTRHAADYRTPYWTIDGTEVNRVLSYWRAGAYHADAAGLDGFAPGTAAGTRVAALQHQLAAAAVITVVQSGPPNYTAGNSVQVTNRFSYSDTLLSLLLRPQLPSGWTLFSATGNGTVEIQGGEIVLLGTLPPSPVEVVMTLQVPTGQSGIKNVRTEVEYQFSGEVNPSSSFAAPDPLAISDGVVPLTVAINQAVGQSDPTSSSPINFTVVFSEPVTGFGDSDVTLGGTAGASTAQVTGSGSTYTVAVSGMAQNGTVIASVAAGVAQDAAGNPNTASTSTDNTVTFSLQPTVMFNPANGHYYQLVLHPERISWEQARSEAASRSYQGLPGHLVTINSLEENQFVYTNFIQSTDANWLGAFQPDGSAEPGGGWQWITGESFEYKNWPSSEPNNNGNENALQMPGGNNGTWNDANSMTTSPGYVVEYEAITQTETLVFKQWEQAFGGTDQDEVNAIRQTSNGGYLLGGVSRSGISGNKTVASFGIGDYWVVKTDGSGNKQWERVFGGSENENAYSLELTSDGGAILGGYSASGVSGNKTTVGFGGEDFWIVKIDQDGNKQWEQAYGGTGRDSLQSLQQTSDGGYILGGFSESGISGNKSTVSVGGLDYWVIKTDGSGNKQWEQTFGGSAEERLVSSQQTSDGGYIVGGYSQSGVSGNKITAGFGGNDFWVIKLDGSGNKQWEQSFGGTAHDTLYSLQQTPDGGYILAGDSFSGAGGNRTSASFGGSDFWIVKIDGNGSKQWEKAYGGSGADSVLRLRVTSDGGFILLGSSTSGVSGDKSSAGFGGSDIWLVKADSAGNKQWDQSFGGSGDDNANFNSLQQTQEGDYIFGGYSESGISGNKTTANFGLRDGWVIKAFARETPPGTPAVLVNGQFSPDNSFNFFNTLSVPVALQTTFANGTIRYTLDGSTPMAISTLYTGPITLSQTVILTAIAFSSDNTQSALADPVTITINGPPPPPRIGTVVAWGNNADGQGNVPVGLSGVVAIAGGNGYSLALKADGTIVAWGRNDAGQISVPTGLSSVVAIDADANGGLSLALKADGTVVAWGNSSPGQTSVPAGLSGVVAIGAGTAHDLALKADGTVVGWGQVDVPAGLSGVVAIAAGSSFSLALRADGTVVAWGSNESGQASVPAGLSDVVAIAAGGGHSLALKADGTIVTWGGNGYGQANVPAGLSGAVAIAAGGQYSLALKADGTVVAWGRNDSGQINVPAGLSGVVAIAAGYQHNLALVVNTPPSPVISNVNLTGTTLTLSASTAAGSTYVLEFKDSLTESSWRNAQTLAGTGNEITLTDSSATSRTRFYRVRVE